MKRSEIIAGNLDAIASEMVRCYRIVLESDGRVQYKIYIWEDGAIESLCGPHGDNTYLKPYDWEHRELFLVDTVSDSGCCSTSDERAWLADEYERTVYDRLDSIIDDAEFEEEYN